MSTSVKLKRSLFDKELVFIYKDVMRDMEKDSTEAI